MKAKRKTKVLALSWSNGFWRLKRSGRAAPAHRPSPKIRLTAGAGHAFRLGRIDSTASEETIKARLQTRGFFLSRIV